MTEELSVYLSTLTSSSESVLGASSHIRDLLTRSPSQVFPFASLWLKSLEGHSNKMALLYLANDLLQTFKVEPLLHCLEEVLPDAFKLMGTQMSVLAEMRRILVVWRQRTVFGNDFLDLLSKICDGLEAASRTNTGKGQILRLAQLLNQLEGLKARRQECTKADYPDLGKIEKQVREDYIVELGRTIKRLNVELTTQCLYLQQINAKIHNLPVAS